MSAPTTRSGPAPARGQPGPGERRQPRARQERPGEPSPAQQRRYLRPRPRRARRYPPRPTPRPPRGGGARAPPTCCGRREEERAVEEGRGSRASPAGSAARPGPAGLRPRRARPAPPPLAARLPGDLQRHLPCSGRPGRHLPAGPAPPASNTAPRAVTLCLDKRHALSFKSSLQQRRGFSRAISRLNSPSSLSISVLCPGPARPGAARAGGSAPGGLSGEQRGSTPALTCWPRFFGYSPSQGWLMSSFASTRTPKSSAAALTEFFSRSHVTKMLPCGRLAAFSVAGSDAEGAPRYPVWHMLYWPENIN